MVMENPMKLASRCRLVFYMPARRVAEIKTHLGNLKRVISALGTMKCRSSSTTHHGDGEDGSNETE